MIDASLFLFYVDPLLDWNPKSCGDDGSPLNLDDFFYFFGECCLKKMSLVQMYNIFLFFKIRVYKWNNEQLIDASLFLFFVDTLLDWNPNSCGDAVSIH